jgi:electron transport complex protein RnfC
VGLGGAAFPLWAKLDAIRKGPIKTVLINGAECEPYITSDHRTMLDNSEMIVKGVELLKEYLHSEEFILGIEDNKKDAIEKMRQVFAADSSVTIKPLKSVYPQGAKQVLLYNAAGLVVGEGQRLASLGYIIINVTTLAKMAEYITTGMPLVERCITVDGSAVREPKNLRVPVGTRISYLIDCCGGLKAQPGKVIFGGPMMGKTAYSMEQPIVKATNAIVVMNKKDSAALEPTACIHCGRCVENCPLNLNPTAYAHALDIEDRAERYALLDREKINLCMECGCCSYVCPARRPLVENNRECKSFVRRYKAELAEKEESKNG